MKKTPCEDIVWNILPCIRRKLAFNLLKMGLSQKEVAEKLEISTAAVSQYLSNKRGHMTSFTDEIEKEIAQSANNILNGDDIITELCRICTLIKNSQGVLDKIC